MILMANRILRDTRAYQRDAVLAASAPIIAFTETWLDYIPPDFRAYPHVDTRLPFADFYPAYLEWFTSHPLRVRGERWSMYADHSPNLVGRALTFIATGRTAQGPSQHPLIRRGRTRTGQSALLDVRIRDSSLPLDAAPILPSWYRMSVPELLERLVDAHKRGLTPVPWPELAPRYDPSFAALTSQPPPD